MKLIFVSSPLKGDIKGNLEKAKGYSRYAEFDGIPITPHLYFSTYMDDAVEIERWRGRFMALQLLSLCQEMYVFCDEVTEGMIEEIKKAEELNIPIRFFNADKEEIKYDSLIINKRIGPGYRKIIADAHGDGSGAGICPYAAECGRFTGSEDKPGDGNGNNGKPAAGKPEREVKLPDLTRTDVSKSKSFWDKLKGRK